MAADNEIQILAETGQAGGEGEANEQNVATSKETQLDGADTQIVKTRTTNKRAGEPIAQTLDILDHNDEVTNAREEKIRNGARDEPRKKRCEKHDASEALE